MVEIPDRLRCLFAARIDERDDSYVIEVPRAEIENRSITPEETYRVVVLPDSPAESAGTTTGAPSSRGIDTRDSAGGRSESREPPVEKGEIRTVSIEAVGDQGDGIAKVERGYVVIVPEAAPGDEVRVEVEQVRPNVAFARVVDTDKGASATVDSAEEPVEVDPDSDSDPDPLSADPSTDLDAAIEADADASTGDPRGNDDRDSEGSETGPADSTEE